MKISRTTDGFAVVFTQAEARAFHDELEHVPGGSRLPKIRQVCRALDVELNVVREIHAAERDRKGRKKS